MVQSQDDFSMSSWVVWAELGYYLVRIMAQPLLLAPAMAHTMQWACRARSWHAHAYILYSLACTVGDRPVYIIATCGPGSMPSGHGDARTL